MDKVFLAVLFVGEPIDVSILGRVLAQRDGEEHGSCREDHRGIRKHIPRDGGGGVVKGGVGGGEGAWLRVELEGERVEKEMERGRG